MKFKFTPKALPVPTDFLNGETTASLGNEEVGALLRLGLVATSSPSCNLPDDDEKLAAISRLYRRWPKHADAIRACLEPDPDEPGRLILPLALEERIRYEAWCEKSSRGGKRGHPRVVEATSKGGSSPSTFPSTFPSSIHPSAPSNPSTSPALAREGELRGGALKGISEKRKGGGRTTADDLRDPVKLTEKFEGAIQKGFITPKDRLNFFAAAQHALNVADPPESAGHLFASIVIDKNWSVITQAEEERALGVIERFDDSIA